MAKTEEHIEKKFGRQTPFTVPEGYFEQLQKNVMDALPEQTAKVIPMTPRRRGLLPIITAAASVCVAICGVTVWLHKVSANDPANMSLAESAEFHEMLSNYDENSSDYIMLDKDDMYTYMLQQ